MEPTMSFIAPTASASTEVAVAPVSPEVPTTAYAPEVPVVAPQDQKTDTTGVNIYADSISLSNGEAEGAAIFDVVLTVSWQSGDSYQTAKVVKTVAFDKASILEKVLCGTPVTVVESVNTKKKESDSKFLRTMRELAGVPGKDTFV